MSMKSFYASLPKVSEYNFSVPYYGEALRTFRGVRVIPSRDWLESLPAPLRDYPCRVGFPSYFIPIFYGRNCYGFVVKGVHKPTPRFCTTFLLPGCEAITGNQIVLLLEGIKDAGPWREVSSSLGWVPVPMLTSVPSTEFLTWLVSMKCRVVYIPDNDEHRGSNISAFHAKAAHINLLRHVFLLSGFKDFGSWYESESNRAPLLEEMRKCILSVRGVWHG